MSGPIETIDRGPLSPRISHCGRIRSRVSRDRAVAHKGEEANLYHSSQRTDRICNSSSLTRDANWHDLGLLETQLCHPYMYAMSVLLADRTARIGNTPTLSESACNSQLSHCRHSTAMVAQSTSKIVMSSSPRSKFSKSPTYLVVRLYNIRKCIIDRCKRIPRYIRSTSTSTQLRQLARASMHSVITSVLGIGCPGDTKVYHCSPRALML